MNKMSSSAKQGDKGFELDQDRTKADGNNDLVIPAMHQA